MADVTGSGRPGSQPRWDPPDDTLRGAVLDRASARGLGRGVLALGLFGLLLLACSLSMLGTGRHVLLVTYLVLALLVEAVAAYTATLWRGHPDHVLHDIVPGAGRALPVLRRGARQARTLLARAARPRKRGWSAAGGVESLVSDRVPVSAGPARAVVTVVPRRATMPSPEGPVSEGSTSESPAGPVFEGPAPDGRAFRGPACGGRAPSSVEGATSPGMDSAHDKGFASVPPAPGSIDDTHELTVAESPAHDDGSSASGAPASSARGETGPAPRASVSSKAKGSKPGSGRSASRGARKGAATKAVRKVAGRDRPDPHA